MKTWTTTISSKFPYKLFSTANAATWILIRLFLSCNSFFCLCLFFAAPFPVHWEFLHLTTFPLLQNGERENFSEMNQFRKAYIGMLSVSFSRKCMTFYNNRHNLKFDLLNFGSYALHNCPLKCEIKPSICICVRWNEHELFY